MKGASLLIILTDIDQIEARCKTFMWDVELLMRKSDRINIIVAKNKKWDNYYNAAMK